jgi:hypothetical protein
MILFNTVFVNYVYNQYQILHVVTLRSKQKKSLHIFQRYVSLYKTVYILDYNDADVIPPHTPVGLCI